MIIRKPLKTKIMDQEKEPINKVQCKNDAHLLPSKTVCPPPIIVEHNNSTRKI